MIIIGHPSISYLPFFKITSPENIKFTLPNSAVIFDFNFYLAKYCKNNNITYAMRVNTIKDLIFSNALECNFAVVEEEFSRIAQNIANEYMFDMKILLFAKSEYDIEWVALNGIDGVIFKEAVKNLMDLKHKASKNCK